MKRVSVPLLSLEPVTSGTTYPFQADTPFTLFMFHIRPCGTNDLAAVHILASEYTSFDATPTQADIEGLYHRNQEYFYVAEDDSGKILGFIPGYERKGIPEEVLRTWKAKRVGYIDLMAVDPSRRKMGIGTMLLSTLLGQFRTTGLDLVILDVPAEQESAVNLYKKLGFHTRAYNMRKSL